VVDLLYAELLSCAVNHLPYVIRGDALFLFVEKEWSMPSFAGVFVHHLHCVFG